MNRKQRRTDQSRGTGSADPVLQGLLNEALQHHQAGRLAEAEPIYRQILALDPRHADGLHLLGVLAHQVGRLDIAVDLIGKAIEIDKKVPSFHNNLGTTLQDQDKPDEAAASFRHALALNPDYAEAHINLGNTLKNQGKFKDAITHYERALALKPGVAQTHNNLGTVLRIEDRLDESVSHYRNAIALKPDYAEAHHNLGNALKDQGKLPDAIASFQQAIALKPTLAEAHTSLGQTLHRQGKYDDAVACCKRALALKPDSAETLIYLGQSLQKQRKFDDAVECYERALTIKPDYIETLNNMGHVAADQGKPDEAIELYKRILAMDPALAPVHENLLMAMVYSASVSPLELAAAAREFDLRVTGPLLRRRPLIRDKDPDRRLRIGYLSPDFRCHSVHCFFEPLLQRHDREKFEIFAYSNTVMEDVVTTRLKQEFDHWRPLLNLSDDKAADLIEDDAIDILIDLAGHTADNRLLVFARKPAPVQVTWLGYPATTGMKAMDYRITDIHAEPEGLTEDLNVETLWRLPEMFCCYQGPENGPAVIDHPPFEDNGYITFGCFNNFSKVNDSVLAAWAKIMEQTPHSRLLLEIVGLENPKFRAAVEARLKNLGLPFDRVILEPRKQSNQFVLYNRIDIALDPFPCNGGTTSLDTLWMGVPLTTLAGEHFVSRLGVTILTNAGMPELIAKNTDEYVRLATDLAQDKDKLRKLRHNLRDRVASSPLMNQDSFTRNMEAAYREMWRRWCNES